MHMRLLEPGADDVRSPWCGPEMGSCLTNEFILRFRMTRPQHMRRQVLLDQRVRCQFSRMAPQPYQRTSRRTLVAPRPPTPPDVRWIAIHNNHDLAFRIPVQTIQEVNHHRWRKTPLENARPRLPRVVHHRNPEPSRYVTLAHTQAPVRCSVDRRHRCRTAALRRSARSRVRSLAKRPCLGL